MRFLLIFFLLYFTACNAQEVKKEKAVEAQAKSPLSNYPDVDYTFINNRFDNIISSKDVLIEIKDDSKFLVNSKAIAFNNLKDHLDSIELTVPVRKRNKIKMTVGIESETRVFQYMKLRKILRQGNWLSVNLLNKNKESFYKKYPPHTGGVTKPKNTAAPPPPPPPPGPNNNSESCLCCEKNGRYFTKDIGSKAIFYNTMSECFKKHLNPQSQIFIEILDDNKIKLNSEAIDARQLYQTMQSKYNDMEDKRKCILILETYGDVNFATYLQALADCSKVFYTAQDQQANNKFGKNYAALPKDQQRKIRSHFPIVISESFVTK